MTKAANDTLKTRYRLNYDNSGFNSGLVIWYNKLVDKRVDELNASDVAKMIRQNILTDVAFDRAVTLFLRDPFDGEMRDGDVLELLVYVGLGRLAKDDRLTDIVNLVSRLESTYMDFEWLTEDEQESYGLNLAALKKGILDD